MRRNPMRFFLEVAQTYGGIARIPLIARTGVYLVSAPGLLHELLVVNRHKYMKNARYREALAFPDRSVDVVLNIEASHLYEDLARFFREVLRVLRSGGQFYYADLFWRDSDPKALLADSGFEVQAEEDLTQNVLRSLDLDSARRMGIIDSTVPPDLRDEFRDWSGVPGYRAYRRFASREWLYRRFKLRRRGL